MKKTLLAMTLFTSLNVNASGIPVVDVASIAQTVTEGLARAQEFKQTLDQAKNEMNHYKSMVEGHYSFEDILHDPVVNDFMTNSDWSQYYQSVSNIDSLRNKYNLKSDDPYRQKMYDSKLKELAFKEEMYQKTKQRSQRLQNLFSQMNTATTPAAKSDIGNAINLEKLSLQNDIQLANTIESMMYEKSESERKQAYIERTKSKWKVSP